MSISRDDLVHALLQGDESEAAEALSKLRAGAAEPVSKGQPVDLNEEPAPPTAKPPVNPYAPTGWRRKQRVEFDLELPSGQLCRIFRLDRDDLIRLDLMQYLDTFSGILMSDNITDQDREAQMQEAVKDNPEALAKMMKAVDKIVMACTVKPQVTDDEALVNYGTQSDWDNPNFVPVAYIEDIDLFERMYIFGAAFGRSMDELKSVLEQANGVEHLADVSGVSQDTQ
jgi:hypothetical protein